MKLNLHRDSGRQGDQRISYASMSASMLDRDRSAVHFGNSRLNITKSCEKEDTLEISTPVSRISLLDLS